MNISEKIPLIKKTKPFWLWLVPDIKTIVLVYVLAIAFVSRNAIDNYFVDNIGEHLKCIYGFITSNISVNLLTTLLVVICGIFTVIRIHRTKSSTWIAIFSLFAVIILWKDNNWVWAETVLLINYRILLILCLLALFLCEFAKSVKRIISSPRMPNTASNAVGFSVTTEREQMQDTGWKRYADNLVSKILKTDTSKESFAVGVSGVWGSGKTTFLNSVEDKLKRQCYLVSFNPWNSDSATQISNDFFQTLISKLTISSYQRHTILKYAKLLGQINAFDSQAKIVSTFFESMDGSLTNAKERAANVIADMPLPVVVVIDDLDRLDGSELLAVLRLVRVTANFKNLVFIVAYDKAYVDQTLSKANIQNGEQFLKKIFPLEICLPSFESFVIADHLYGELRTCIHNDMIVSKLEYAVYHGTVNHRMPFYLPTFRDVKRFVNQFSLNLNAFVSENKLSEIDETDLFFIELLHYYDFNAYQQLQNNPQSLLSFTSNIHGKYEYYFRRPGTIKGAKEIEKQDDVRAKVLDDFMEGVDDLLWMVFGSGHNNGDNLARYPNNFSKYFSYRINRDVIGIEEFRQFLEKDTKEELIEQLKVYSRGDVSRRTSMMYHLTSTSLDKNNERQVYNVAYSLIELAMFGSVDPSTSIKQMFAKKLDEEDGVVPGALMKAIRAQIGHYRNSWNVIQNILVSLVELDFNEPSEEDGYVVSYRSVLNWEQLKSLAEENFESARNGRIISIEKITDEKSQYHKFLERAVATTNVICYDGEHDEKISHSLLLDKLIEIYSQNSHKKEVKQFFENLDPRSDYWDEHGYDDEKEFSYSLHRNIDSVFGSTYKDQDFYKFLKAAFVDCLPEVNMKLKNLGLKEIELDAEKQEE